MKRMLRTVLVFAAVMILVGLLCAGAAFAADAGSMMPWLDRAGKNGTVSVRYIMQGDSLLDIRKQNWNALKKFNIGQGACTDGTYYYVGLEKRSHNQDKVRIRIVKVRISDGKVVMISAPLKLGHANSIVYNPNINLLLVTGKKYHDPNIRLVNPRTLTICGKVEINARKGKKRVQAFNAMGYDEESDLYYLRARGKAMKNRIFVLNGNFQVIRSYKINQDNTEVQGLSAGGGYFLLTQAMKQTTRKNTVTLYDSNGKRVRTFRLNMGSGEMASGELESIFHMGDRWYGTVHKKFKKSGGKGKKYKSTYIFEIRL